MPDEFGPKTTHTTTDTTLAVAALLVGLAALGIYLGGALDWYYGFLEWFYSFNWRRILFTSQILFFILDMALIALVAFTLRRYAGLTRVRPPEEAMPHTVTPQKEARGSWEHIKTLANSSNPSDWNMAVLRADSLLDDSLMHLGYEGTSLAERLKIVDPTKLTSIDNVWSAHRLRNMIAHDPLEQHTKETIIHALRSYEQALKELGVLTETSEG